MLAETDREDEILALQHPTQGLMLNADSLRITRSAIAYLYQNVVQLERKDNLAFYDEVTQEGLDFPEMHQLPRELVLLRKSGDQLAEVRVGIMDVVPAQGAQPTPAAFRLLVAETGSSKPVKFFQEAADTAFEKFQAIWGGRLGQLQLVEVSFQASLAAGDDGAAGFFEKRILKLDQGAKGHLGRDFGQFGMKLGSGVLVDTRGGRVDPDSLAGAQIDITLETSPQDSRVMALQIAAKWPVIQMRLSGLQLPAEVRSQLGGRDFIEMNKDARPPNEYVDSVYNYLNRRVVAFLKAAGR